MIGSCFYKWVFGAEQLETPTWKQIVATETSRDASFVFCKVKFWERGCLLLVPSFGYITRIFLDVF